MGSQLLLRQQDTHGISMHCLCFQSPEIVRASGIYHEIEPDRLKTLHDTPAILAFQGSHICPCTPTG